MGTYNFPCGASTTICSVTSISFPPEGRGASYCSSNLRSPPAGTAPGRTTSWRELFSLKDVVTRKSQGEAVRFLNLNVRQ